MQTFYHGLTNSTRETIDAATGGSFLSLTTQEATTLIEKMASNQDWNEERTQTRKRGGMHQLKEVDMLSAQLDLMMKRLDEQASEKKEIMLVHESRMTCEECGETGHSGKNCPVIQGDINYLNNNYRPQGWNQQQRPNYSSNYLGNYQDNNCNNVFNQPPLRELLANQSKAMDQLSKKVTANDKILENINTRMDSFTSAIKNQHSFNKIIESHISQLAAIVPPADKGKIPGQPEDLETVNLIDIFHAGWYHPDQPSRGWKDESLPEKNGDPGDPSSR
jgi:hypothetical protein